MIEARVHRLAGTLPPAFKDFKLELFLLGDLKYKRMYKPNAKYFLWFYFFIDRYFYLKYNANNTFNVKIFKINEIGKKLIEIL